MDYFLAAYAHQYQNKAPFPHGVLDGFFSETELREVAKEFVIHPEQTWWKYDNALEKKLAFDKLHEMPPHTRKLIYFLMSSTFVGFLEKLTGIPDLITDHDLNGGGMHQIFKGGKLDIHADFNYHPKTKLHRRLNIIVYLNENWDPQWGGALELWDKEMTQCVASYIPIFNRMVIFNTTDTSFHGHPDPLQCPESISRKSIAMYYYTMDRPESEKSAPHSVLFQRRPQDPIIEEVEELRKKRAVRRLQD